MIQVNLDFSSSTCTWSKGINSNFGRGTPSCFSHENYSVYVSNPHLGSHFNRENDLLIKTGQS